MFCFLRGVPSSCRYGPLHLFQTHRPPKSLPLTTALSSSPTLPDTPPCQPTCSSESLSHRSRAPHLCPCCSYSQGCTPHPPCLLQIPPSIGETSFFNTSPKSTTLSEAEAPLDSRSLSFNPFLVVEKLFLLLDYVLKPTQILKHFFST